MTVVSPTASAASRPLLPGLALAVAVAVAAGLAEPALKAATGGRIGPPAMVIALAIGVLLNRFAAAEVFRPGIGCAVRTVLRGAIALLGLRIALGDIADLGLSTVLLVAASMATTVTAAVGLARLLGREAGYGALAGAANAVCGASATLAAATVVPDYRTKSADIAFVVVMTNVVSTLAMLAYPPLCALLGLSERETGLMLGLTIHDVAQVAGAGYAVAEPVGDVAVIVKLFRVFLLLPVVLAIGWWFLRRGDRAGEARVPVPVFALVFVALSVLGSVLPATPLADLYRPVAAVLAEASRWGLLVAIAALGLGTSLAAIVSIGWRHLAVFLGASLVVLVAGTGGILLLR